MFETAQNYEARAYTFQGLKSEERKYRMRNLKRCQGNRFCYQSLEQGGRRWVISSYGSKEGEILTLCPSSRASDKESALISSSDKRRPSGSRSQSPTIEALEQLDREKGRTEVKPPTSTRNITQRSVNAPKAVRPNHRGLANLSEADTRVVATGSATTSSPTRAINGQEKPISSFPYDEEKACASALGIRKQKSKEQLERRKERRRRAQRGRRTKRFDQQDLGLEPRILTEARKLLHKQEVSLHSAHQAELQKQELALHSAHQAELQKQELALHAAHQVELQEQKLVLYSAHQTELYKQGFALYSAYQADFQKQELELRLDHQAAVQEHWLLLHSAYGTKFEQQESAHQEVLREQSLKLEQPKLESLAQEQAANQEHRNKINITIDLYKITKGYAGYIRPRSDGVRKALLLVEQVDDDVLSVLKNLFRLSSQSVNVSPRTKKRLNVGSIFNIPLTTAQKGLTRRC